MQRTLAIFFCILLVATGCTTQENTSSLIVSLSVDGQERSYPQPIPITVGEFLQQSNVVLGSLDEVTPPLFTQIGDGMRITVARVSEAQECENEELPFRENRIPNEGLDAGEERVAQPGQSGVEEVCYRVTIRDGRRQERVPIRTTVITAAQDAVIYYGPTGELDSVPIEGSLAYISNGNAWVMRGDSSNKRLLTSSGDLDNRVFALTANGRQLLVSRTAIDPTYFNQLWVINDTTNTNAIPVMLPPQNVLTADWVPNQADTISYSSGELTENSPGWQAYNDLWLMRFDANSGDSLNARQLVDRSSGWLYSWWGTVFQWSPDGSKLAWVRADSMGLVDTNSGDFQTLLTYPVFSTGRQPWSWRADVSWSADSNLILTTVHGRPIGSEPAETSPAFHNAVTNTDGTLGVELVQNAGIWSKPKYSPQAGGLIAYLRARDLANSISESSEYDLVVADRDGSNARVVYPPTGQPGITANAPFFTWSPSGTQLAFIYGGNLWVVDVGSGVAHQVTLDRGASNPVWTQ
jgi:hypothetical protein